MTLIILSILLPLAGDAPHDKGRPHRGPWSVVTTSGDTIRGCAIAAPEAGRAVFVITDGDTVRHWVDSVKLLFRPRGSKFWTGAGYGALAGAVTGALIGLAGYEEPAKSGFTLDFGPGFSAAVGATFGAVAGFAVGGIIGAASSREELITLEGQTPVRKLEILHDLSIPRE